MATDLGRLTLRSFRIFGEHWAPIMRAFGAPVAIAFVVFGIAFLAIPVIDGLAPRFNNRAYWNVVGLIVAGITTPLLLSYVILAVAGSIGDELPYPATFSTATGLWPSQAQVVLVLFAPAAALSWLAGWVLQTTVAVRGVDAVAKAPGLVVVTCCLVCAATLSFLGMLAAIPVALRDERPLKAIVAAFDRLFLRDVFAGLSAAVLFGVLLSGIPALLNLQIALLAAATHFLPLLVLTLIVSLAFTGIAATYALLFARDGMPDA